jgi:hypothetical protein
MRRPSAHLVHLARDIGSLAVDQAKLAPLLAVAHHDERPVLGIARRGRSNGGVQNAGDDFLRDWIGFQSAQGPCGGDGVEQSDLRHREPHVANAFGSLSASATLARIWRILESGAATMAAPTQMQSANIGLDLLKAAGR